MSRQQRLTLQLDFRSGLPAYLQIVRHVERQAAAGRLARDAQLPTVRGLAVQLGVNFNTVARAYRLLNRAGVVSTQRGRGTYILERTATAAVGRSRQEMLEWLAGRYVTQAKELHFTAAEVVETVRRRLAREPERT